MPQSWRAGASQAFAPRWSVRIGSNFAEGELASIHLARLVGRIGLDPLKYATHSMRRTKATTKLWISHH
jgi:hypothetical protein